MNTATPLDTFRDPAGSLSLHGDKAIRTIHPAAEADVLEFLASDFCLRMQDRGDLIADEVDASADGLRLYHPLVPVPTYPWEWTPSQWLAAAELTLRLGEEALGEGWVLKDATPHNILFVGARPLLVDVLSFERRDSTSTVWLAYGQYVRTFLLPLLMRRMLGWPLSLMLFKRDGYEPSEVYRSLGWLQRLSRGAFWPITLPTWLEQRKNSVVTAKRKGQSDPDLTAYLLRKKFQDLLSRTRRAARIAETSEWSRYTSSLAHYTEGEVTQKSKWLAEVFEEIRPGSLLDVGANTGEYSVLAASGGAQVVSLERDEAAAERLFRRSVAGRLAIQTIHADLARPTPAVGWKNCESLALLDRLEGKFEAVMLLAVIHHLLLLEQIPLAEIMSLCQNLTSRFLILEWVPATDSMYVSLMRGRDELYGKINETTLMESCRGRFTLLKRLTLENGRTLLLFERA